MRTRAIHHNRHSHNFPAARNIVALLCAPHTYNGLGSYCCRSKRNLWLSVCLVRCAINWINFIFRKKNLSACRQVDMERKRKKFQNFAPYDSYLYGFSFTLFFQSSIWKMWCLCQLNNGIRNAHAVSNAVWLFPHIIFQISFFFKKTFT